MCTEFRNQSAGRLQAPFMLEFVSGGWRLEGHEHKMLYSFVKNKSGFRANRRKGEQWLVMSSRHTCVSGLGVRFPRGGVGRMGYSKQANPVLAW